MFMGAFDGANLGAAAGPEGLGCIVGYWFYDTAFWYSRLVRKATILVWINSVQLSESFFVYTVQTTSSFMPCVKHTSRPRRSLRYGRESTLWNFLIKMFLKFLFSDGVVFSQRNPFPDTEPHHFLNLIVSVSVGSGLSTGQEKAEFSPVGE